MAARKAKPVFDIFVILRFTEPGSQDEALKPEPAGGGKAGPDAGAPAFPYLHETCARRRLARSAREAIRSRCIKPRRGRGKLVAKLGQNGADCAAAGPDCRATMSRRDEGPALSMIGFALAGRDVLRFEDFRLDRRGGLFRLHESGQLEAVVLGSRAMDILTALAEQAGERGDETGADGSRLAWTGGRGRQPDGADLHATPRSRRGAQRRKLYPDGDRARLSFPAVSDDRAGRRLARARRAGSEPAETPFADVQPWRNNRGGTLRGRPALPVAAVGAAADAVGRGLRWPRRAAGLAHVERRWDPAFRRRVCRSSACHSRT